MVRKILLYCVVAATIGSALGLVLFSMVYQRHPAAVEQSQPVPSSSQTRSTPDEIEPSRASFPITVTQWKTYQNDKYGFSFKYPDGWSLIIKEEDVITTIPYAIASLDIIFQTDMKDELGKPRWGGLLFDIYGNPRNLSLENWIRGTYYDDKRNLLQLSKPKFSIGNSLEALKITDDKAYWDQHPNVFHSNLPNYYLRAKSSFYVLSWYVQAFTYNVSAIESQILPSFSFVK